MRIVSILALILILSSACKRQANPYNVSGRVVDPFGKGMSNVAIIAGDTELLTDSKGNFTITGLTDAVLLQPIDSAYSFVPEQIEVDAQTAPLIIQGYYRPDAISGSVLTWLQRQQLANGLVPSAENGNVISLYDQALAALALMAVGDMDRARKIFDFFDQRIDGELREGPGGFSQFRDRNGTPGRHRWMGDNAWLLIALHHYEDATSDRRYARLIGALTDWLKELQDTDGGLWAGYAADNMRLNYKVTEGMIDAFVAVEGFTDFHTMLLDYLATDRWDNAEQNLIAWVGHPKYQWALDNFSWAYCAFPEFPATSLDGADRFRSSQTAAVTGAILEGYDIDEDRETIFMEGTGQMALAFRLAGRVMESEYYRQQMRLAYVSSDTYAEAGGFPYASNAGSGYGSDPLWPTAHTEIALSPGVWYLLAQVGFNPLRPGRDKQVTTGRFW